MKHSFLGLTALLSACTYYVPLSNPQTHNQVIQQPLAAEKSCQPPLERIVEVPVCPEKSKEQPEKKQDSSTPEYRALLDTIAWAEGTGCHYNMMVGRMLFKDYSAHPLETGEMPQKGIPFTEKRRYKGRSYSRTNYSTAAGRYQFLYRTYTKLRGDGFFQTGFTPEEQDKAALYLIQKKDVTQELLEEAVAKKEFTQIWHALSGEWASLPDKKTKRSKHRQFAYQEVQLQHTFFIFYGNPKK